MNKNDFDYESSMFFGLKRIMSDEQEAYVKGLFNSHYKIIGVNAKSGSGKTTLAVAAAKILIDTKQYDELFYVFAPVEESEMGYTPGTLFEKERKYHGPLIDALLQIGCDPAKCIFDPNKLEEEENKEAQSKAQGDKKKKEKTPKVYKKYWVTPLSHVFLRGRNLKNKVVIIDEAQNFTTNELRKILTRCHDTCKVILIGHTGQCDIDSKTSGFDYYLAHMEKYKHGEKYELTQNYRGSLANWADDI